MNESQKELLDDIQKTLKIWKIKSIRAWHRFDKQTGVSRSAKKMTLALGLKLITLAMPNAQISLHAQNVSKASTHKTELLAKANAAKSLPDYTHFIENNQEALIERQKEFALALWDNISQNIKTIQNAEKKGTRTKTLRHLFGQYKKYNLHIDPEYFCASSGLGSVIQTFEETNFMEYEAIIECLTNPNHCASIIKDMDATFGPGIKTKNARKTLADIYEQNPYAVCWVLAPSSRSRSGYHFTTTFSNTIAVDTLLSTKEDSLKGKVATFNRTMITDTEKYYPNLPASAKKEYRVYDLSKIVLNIQLYQMYLDYLEKKDNRKPIHIEEIAPIAFNHLTHGENKTFDMVDARETIKEKVKASFPHKKTGNQNNEPEKSQQVWAAVSNMPPKNLSLMKKKGRSIS